MSPVHSDCYLPRQRPCSLPGKAISDAEAELIRQAARRNQLAGSSRFIDEIEKKLGNRIEMRGRGRPKNPQK